MNYIKEAEKYLYHYRDLYYSIKNIDREIEKLTMSGPKDISAIQYDATGIPGTIQQDEAINIIYKIQILTNNREETKRELEKIDNILDEISEENQYYGPVLKKWYIERIPKEEIAKEIGYSSKRSIYYLRSKAIRKFAIRLFGLDALKMM